MINHRNDCVQSFVYILFFHSFMGKKTNHFERHLPNGPKIVGKIGLTQKSMVLFVCGK